MSIKLPNGQEIKLWDVKFVEPDWKAPDGREVTEVIDPAEVERMADVLESYAWGFEHAIENGHTITHRSPTGGRGIVVRLHEDRPCDCAEQAQRARSHARSATRTRLVKVEVR